MGQLAYAGKLHMGNEEERQKKVMCQIGKGFLENLLSQLCIWCVLLFILNIFVKTVVIL